MPIKLNHRVESAVTVSREEEEEEEEEEEGLYLQGGVAIKMRCDLLFPINNVCIYK